MFAAALDVYQVQAVIDDCRTLQIRTSLVRGSGCFLTACRKETNTNVLYRLVALCAQGARRYLIALPRAVVVNRYITTPIGVVGRESYPELTKETGLLKLRQTAMAHQIVHYRDIIIIINEHKTYIYIYIYIYIPAPAFLAALPLAGSLEARWRDGASGIIQ